MEVWDRATSKFSILKKSHFPSRKCRRKMFAEVAVRPQEAAWRSHRGRMEGACKTLGGRFDFRGIRVSHFGGKHSRRHLCNLLLLPAPTGDVFECPSRLDSYFVPCLLLLRLDFRRHRWPSRRAPRLTRRWSTRQRRRCRQLVSSSSLSLWTRPPPCLRICRRRLHNHRHRQLVQSASCLAEPVRLSPPPLAPPRFPPNVLAKTRQLLRVFFNRERGVLMPVKQRASNL
jgi:hypothetical protein